MTTILPTLLEEALEIKSMKLDLKRMYAFDAALGYPSRQFRSVHIAGTNGKGSVATKIASAYPGKRVALFTSPHIASYRERIQINKEWIPTQKAEELLKYIVETVSEKPSYFELLTLLAFTYFAQEKVDLAVLEVGMGGRLDATNIVTPLLSVITSIDLDHTSFLGCTLEEIAVEKGGIMKPGVPVVVGPRACFYPKRADLHEVRGTFAHFEEENQAIARKALQLLGVDECDVSDVPPYRFEKKGRFIFDVAHNPAALKRLFERVHYVYPDTPVRAFVAFSADKDVKGCLKIVREHTVAFHYVRVEHSRLLIPKTALSIEEALAFAQPEELLLICGSFFMIEPLRAALEDRYLEKDISTDACQM